MFLVPTAIHFGNRSVRTLWILCTKPLHIGNRVAQYNKIMRLAAYPCSCMQSLATA